MTIQAGHGEIRDDNGDVIRVLLEESDGVFAAAGDEHFIALNFECTLDDLSDAMFIIHH